MPKSKTSLNDLLYDIRRIEEHREVLTESKIKKIYKSLMKDLDAFLGDGYKKYADSDGRFFLSYLDAQNKRASFLNEIVENVDGITPKLKRQIENLIDDTYEATYSGMVEALQKADTAEKLKYITADISVQEDVLKETVSNNVNKLTLPSVLEKHRAEIVYSIQQELAVGLMNGDRYDQMAKRIAEKVNISQTKAMNIARTESHRNIESGFMDCAENIQDGLDGSEYIYAATWRTMKDGNVRPYSRRRTKGGWKTYKSSNGADHTIMEGVTVKAGEMFDLQDGNETKAPGKSGIAKHDCNCRCYLEYNLMSEKEFAEATNQSVEDVREKYSNKTLDNSAESGIIKVETDTKNGTNTNRNIELPDNVKVYDEKLTKNSDYITGKVGEFSEDDIRNLSAKNGVEYAVMTCGDTSILIRGNETSTEISQSLINKLVESKGTLDFHTHAYNGDIIPSQSDMLIMKMFEEKTGQQVSKIVSSDGQYSVFDKYGVIETGTVKRKIKKDYEKFLKDLFS